MNIEDLKIKIATMLSDIEVSLEDATSYEDGAYYTGMKNALEEVLELIK
ncbi:MAG: hypothetical protein M0P49_07640 [Bacilli bacterium]|nr:hypothetical protein [Bacilli bacterium]